jgi:hypothetical protein
MIRTRVAMTALVAAMACTGIDEEGLTAAATTLVGRWDVIDHPTSMEFYPGGYFSLFGEAGTETGTTNF